MFALVEATAVERKANRFHDLDRKGALLGGGEFARDGKQRPLFLLRQLEFAIFDFRLHMATQAPDAGFVQRTLEAVRRDWDLRQTWGWDFPMLAMTAARRSKWPRRPARV